MNSALVCFVCHLFLAKVNVMLSRNRKTISVCRLVCAFLCVTWATSLCSTISAADAVSTRPNIILIIADDLGCDDCEPYGNRAVRTPNLARLAREGMRFDRAFLTCSSCSPSRASIITSRYPHATGAAELHQPVPKEQVTFVERLRAAGYWTAAAGKWHLGPALKDRFDLVVEAGGKLPPNVPRDGSGCEQWVPTLDRRDPQKPFFLWLAAFDPHRDYAVGATEPPHAPEAVVVPPYYPDRPAVRGDLALYYDEISRLDRYVGKVLEALDAHQLTENTLVVFMTDNGRPFPRCKTTLYDSGIRTPLIARWPKSIRPGSVCPSLVSSIDLGPTFVDLAGADRSPSFQGLSLTTLFRDPQATVRDFTFAEHNWHDYQACERSVRSEGYKLIVNDLPELPGTPPADAVRGATYQEMRKIFESQVKTDGSNGLTLTPAQQSVFIAPRAREELYHVDSDPHELTNLIDDPRHLGHLDRLRTALAEWRRQTRDREPLKLTPDKFDRRTGEPLPKP